MDSQVNFRLMSLVASFIEEIAEQGGDRHATDKRAIALLALTVGAIALQQNPLLHSVRIKTNGHLGYLSGDRKRTNGRLSGICSAAATTAVRLSKSASSVGDDCCSTGG